MPSRSFFIGEESVLESFVQVVVLLGMLYNIYKEAILIHFYKSFLISISILITCAYLFNLGFKYIFKNATLKVKQAVIVGIFIFSGWLTMVLAVKGDEYTLFDLRAVPIIFGTLFFRNPRLLLIVGFGIALARYTIAGITPQAITGSINIMLLGCLGALLVSLYERKFWSYKQKAFVSILSINTLQVICIAWFGSLPTDYYLQQVALYTYPTSIFLSALFVFIIRDFYKDQLRVDQLHNMNLILRRQTHELRQSKQALEEKAQQLMLASRYKSEFIANMSHELKTPLNSILVLSQLIRENHEGADHNEELRYADIIHTSGNELLQMINDILDLSKIEAGKMDIMLDLIVIEELIHMINQQFRHITDQKGLRFKVSVAQDVPPMITSDVQKLNQILRNLLGNAIKFTEHGSIDLLVQIDRNLHANSSAYIVFTVCDTGIGIDADKQKLIFEAFQQEDGAINRKYGGTGLGLSISQQLAKLLGGTLSLQSEKGKGSRFSLTLPVQHQLDTAEETSEGDKP
jgi:signal transduction histidine kinase